MENEIPKINIKDCVEIKPTHIKQSIYTEIDYPFIYKGQVYITKNRERNHDCNNCAFIYSLVSSCMLFICTGDKRKDGNYVIYERVYNDK